MSNKELKNLNIVIIGHVDSGKSTTCGKLIQHLGKIDQRLLDKYAKEASEMGKGSFQFAWVMDKLKAERERGITIKESLNELFTKTKKITIIDAPGHRDFIKNMISGTSQADAAFLMIAGAKGEFEAGISETGQTKEHAVLAQTLGIKHIVCCINKMDMTIPDGGKEFDKKRYEEIVNYMTEYLTKQGFSKKYIQFVPISGFHGDNLMEKSDRSPWYKGKTLLEVIEDLPIPKRPVNKPLRLPIMSKFKISGVGTVFSGRVETGVIKPGMLIHIAPANINTEVKSIEMHHTPLPEALPGDNIGLNVKNVSIKDINKGMVIGDAKNNPPQKAESFVARCIIMNHNGEIKVGYSPVIHIHAAHVTCKMEEILDQFDKRSGKVMQEKPKFIKKNQGANIKFVPTKNLVVESFKEFSPLGRFSIRDMNTTVGVGVITSVTRAEKKEKVKK